MGTLNGTNLFIHSSTDLQDATTSPQVEYLSPRVALDSSSHMWVAAIRDTGISGTNRYRPFAMRSTDTIQAYPASFPTEYSLGRGSVSGDSLALASIGSDKMALTFAGEGGNNNVLGFSFDGTSWSEASTDGTFGWSTQGVDSVLYYVEAMTVGPDGTVYVAGSQTSNADGPRIVLRWDGTGWTQVGASTSTFSFIKSLKVGPDGYLYMGGLFSSIGGVSVQNLVRWNGTVWENFGSDTDGAVSEILFSPGGMLYVGGQFTTVGGTAASGVAVWNGTSWSALGSGIQAYYLVSMALAPNGDLYVGSHFYSAGGVSAWNIAKWDGSSWSALGSGADGTVHDLCVAPNGHLYATGYFSFAGGVSAPYVASWDGTSWNALGGGLSSYGSAITCTADNGSIVGGTFSAASGTSANHVARWNGTTWSEIAGGLNYDVHQLEQDAQGNVWARGGTSLALGRNVVVSGGLGGLTARAFSLVPGEPGAAHLLYSDASLDLQRTTFTASSASWGAPSLIHTGGVTSVSGTYQSTTQKLHVWFSEANQVKYTAASTPFTSWSTPTNFTLGGGPGGISSSVHASETNSILTSWTLLGSYPSTVIALVSSFVPPTATPTNTATASPTPTVTRTSTPAPTLTATPSATSTPLPTPPPPPEVERGTPGDQRDRAWVIVNEHPLPITGSGIIGYTVEIRVDGILVGSAPIQAPPLGVQATEGRWSFTLPPLAPGARLITTTYVDQQGTRGETSSPTTVIVLMSAPLDLSGKGDTAIVSWRRTGDKISYKSRRASTSTWTTNLVPGRYPVPADYDQDGITDLAAIARTKGAFRWNINLSSTGSTVSSILGKAGDTIIGGCRFVPNSGRSLAVFDPSTRTLTYKSIVNAKQRSVALEQLHTANILGCGDTDSDGLDELLFSTKSKDNKVTILSYSAQGARKVVSGRSRLLRGLVINRPSSPVPLLAILSGSHKGGRQVRITTLAGSFAFPLFHVARDATVGAGVFTDESVEQVPGLFWADNRTGRVYRRLLRKGAETSELFALPEGYSLIRPHFIGRTGRLVKR